jgi:hypothetical protein
MQASNAERAGPATQLADSLISRLLETRVADSVIERVVESLMRSAALQRLVAKVVTCLETSPALDALVDRQMDRVLAALRESDALRKVIRDQAGDYLEYLAEHSEKVQKVVQGQSRGVARDLQESIREHVMTLDEVLESWAHRVLLGRA